MGFRIKIFQDKYPRFPKMIAAYANNPEFFEDLDVTYPVRMLSSLDDFDAHYLDKRPRKN